MFILFFFKAGNILFSQRSSVYLCRSETRSRHRMELGGKYTKN